MQLKQKLAYMALVLGSILTVVLTLVSCGEETEYGFVTGISALLATPAGNLCAGT